MTPLAPIVLLPLLAGTLCCLWVGHRNTPTRRRATAWVAGAVTAAALALLLSLAPRVFGGEVLLSLTEW
ncbi:MAG TPA: hypothetical protein VEZ89_03335, partial [Rubrivivax sp.]|nr:hypothetical protein [Rubrivivax sp.]